MTDTESVFRQKLIAEAYLENSKLQLKELKENVIVLIGLIKTGQNAKAYLQMLVVETLLESKPSPSDVSEGVAVRTKKGNWIPYKPSWAAPACNSRQIVKLNNGWVCCATYYYNKNHLEKDPCWQWKNDSGEWIDPDAVIYWKGLEE